MWQEYINANDLDDVLQTLSERGERARIIAGGTDLIIEIERGVRKDIETLIDVSRIQDLNRIEMDDQGLIHIGPLVTHNQCVASNLIRERCAPLAEAAWQIGAPQIRNRGTIAGNIITASPANDTIPPLVAAGASVVLKSVNGERTVPLSDFYTGVRQTVMRPDEMVSDIQVPAMNAHQKGTFKKLGLRRAQAISIVNASVILEFDADRINEATITLGAVAPTIIHAREAQSFLHGKRLENDVITQAAELSSQAARPIDDIRGSAEYRRAMVRVLTARCLRDINANGHSTDLPKDPIFLWGNQSGEITQGAFEREIHVDGAPIHTTINGKPYTFNSGYNKTLLRLLREDAGLTGTKEGCAEGECGACTVFLDGVAVMACLVPAPRVHNAHITTVEGIVRDGGLNPVQQSFIDDGAVQCGYCTPGFIMTAVKLLEERPNPGREDILQALTGNLCRCTGYYKIIEAIEHANNK